MSVSGVYRDGLAGIEVVCVCVCVRACVRACSVEGSDSDTAST